MAEASPADIVITSNSGYPLDMNLYQVVKGMVTAASAANSGGVIIIAAECSEGVGHGSFGEFITSCSTVEELFEKSNEDPPMYDKWQVQEYASVLKEHTVILISRGINKGKAERMFLRSADSMDEALEMAFDLKGSGASVNVIPEGPTVMPVIGRE
jgi:nickel-dependent lactate racemase